MDQTAAFDHSVLERLGPDSRLYNGHEYIRNGTPAQGFPFFEADSLVFDPYYVSAIGHQRQDCYVEGRPSTLHEQLVDMNHMTRQATRWGSLGENGDISSMDFSLGPDNCLAFEKRGPRWGGGYIWLVHVATCRKDGQPVSLTDVDAVMAALHIEQRDPNGNLVH